METDNGSKRMRTLTFNGGRIRRRRKESPTQTGSPPKPDRTETRGDKTASVSSKSSRRDGDRSKSGRRVGGWYQRAIVIWCPQLI